MPRPSEHHLNQACGQLVSSKLDENLKGALKLQVASSLDVKCGVVLVSSCPSITEAYFSYLKFVNLDTLEMPRLLRAPAFFLLYLLFWGQYTFSIDPRVLALIHQPE